MFRDKDDDAKISVAGNEHHFITGVVFVQALEDRPEIRIAVLSRADVTAQDRTTAFFFQRFRTVAGFGHDHESVQIGLVLFTIADIFESLLHQFSNAVVGDA